MNTKAIKRGELFNTNAKHAMRGSVKFEEIKLNVETRLREVLLGLRRANRKPQLGNLE